MIHAERLRELADGYHRTVQVITTNPDRVNVADTEAACLAGASALEIVKRLANTAQPERYGSRIQGIIIAAQELMGDKTDG